MPSHDDNKHTKPQRQPSRVGSLSYPFRSINDTPAPSANEKLFARGNFDWGSSNNAIASSPCARARATKAPPKFQIPEQCCVPEPVACSATTWWEHRPAWGFAGMPKSKTSACRRLIGLQISRCNWRVGVALQHVRDGPLSPTHSSIRVLRRNSHSLLCLLHVEQDPIVTKTDDRTKLRSSRQGRRCRQPS